MRGKYRIYVIGDIPRDIKERVMAIHVAGILGGKEGKDIQTSSNARSKKKSTRKMI
jgi:hypothetical protein